MDDIGVKERFWNAYRYLYTLGYVRNQKELAEKMDAHASSISRAMTGDTKYLTEQFLQRFNVSFDNMFNLDWLLYGRGEMLAKPMPQHITQNNVNGNNSVEGVIMGGDGNYIAMANRYDDSPSEERKWVPVVPRGMASMPEFDILGHMKKQMTGGNIEKLYSGTLNIDCWHYITDHALEPRYEKGDCLGLKSMPKDDMNIIPGRLYVVDTKSNGLVTRYMYNGDNGSIVARSANTDRFPDMTIPKEDIITVYKKIIMFRY